MENKPENIRRPSSESSESGESLDETRRIQINNQRSIRVDPATGRNSVKQTNTPSRRAGPPRKPPTTPSISRRSFAPRGETRFLFLTAFLLVMAVLMVVVFSGFVGYQSGQKIYKDQKDADHQAYLEEQYTLAILDYEEGRLQLALQRLEYIYSENPTMKEAADKWVEIQLAMQGTATPLDASSTPQPTISPTPDSRPKEDLFVAAQQHYKSEEWTETIETLLSLRKTDPNYRYVEVDGMIYAALRNRGVVKILNEGQFEAGLYDFSLAEKYGPLDGQAENYRGWARLYLQGNSFWYAYPEIAASYYGQLVGVAPNLTDASGYSAWGRYWQSLLQIAEQYEAAEDWCAAEDAYQTVINAGSNAEVEAAYQAAKTACLATIPTETPTPSLIPTSTLTPVPSETYVLPTITPKITTPTKEITAPVNTATSTPVPVQNTPTLTNTPVPMQNTPTFTNTPVPPVPTDTPVPPTETSTATTESPGTEETPAGEGASSGNQMVLKSLLTILFGSAPK